MPRAFLKTKNRGGHKTYKCTVCNEPIEAGDQYYTWKFNRGGRYFQHATHGHPRRSQLSNSKMAAVWDAVDLLDLGACESTDDIKTALAEVAQAANDVAQEYGEAADNIEQSFPSGNPTSEACRETADALESWASDLEGWEPEDDDPRDQEHADLKAETMESLIEEYLEAARSSAQDAVDEQPEYAG